MWRFVLCAKKFRLLKKPPLRRFFNFKGENMSESKRDGELPNGLEIVGGLAPDDIYWNHIRQLDLWTPTPTRAASELTRLGYDSVNLDRMIKTAQEQKDLHTMRALAAIAGGDQRGMGQIYHEIRLTDSDGLISPTDIDKTMQEVRRRDPNGDKSPFFS